MTMIKIFFKDKPLIISSKKADLKNAHLAPSVKNKAFFLQWELSPVPKKEFRAFFYTDFFTWS